MGRGKRGGLPITLSNRIIWVGKSYKDRMTGDIYRIQSKAQVLWGEKEVLILYRMRDGKLFTCDPMCFGLIYDGAWRLTENLNKVG